MSWRTRWRTYEYVRNSLWIVPGALAAAATVLGLVLPDLDIRSDAGIDFGPDASRAVLGALAGGMITFTGFVFSILLLAVQFGSSQFTPRMLRRFLRDPTTKIAFGVFVATFIYSLLVLRTVGRLSDDQFVPDFSVEIALLLLLLSMILFLRLISHTTQGLRVAAVVGDIGRSARESILNFYREPASGPEQPIPPELTAGAPRARISFDHDPGVLQSVDFEGIGRLATEADAVIELVPGIGDFVVPGDELFRVFGGSALDEERLRKSVATGDERTLKQDPAFGFRLLADISSKALSPGVNDPSTAIQALDQLELLLRVLAQRELTPGVWRDSDGRVRLIFPAQSWEDYLSLALAETRQYGEGSVQVARRLTALLHDLRDKVPEHRRPAVEAELHAVIRGIDRSFPDPADRIAAGTEDRQGIGSSRDARAEGAEGAGA